MSRGLSKFLDRITGRAAIRNRLVGDEELLEKVAQVIVDTPQYRPRHRARAVLSAIWAELQK